MNNDDIINLPEMAAGAGTTIENPLGGSRSESSGSGQAGFIVNNGWILVHRKLLDNPICKKPHWGWLWVVLLLKANHDNAEFIWNGELMKLKKGQFVTGRKTLAVETGIPESTVEDILKYLERQHQIRQQKTTKYRVITILNWEKYQKSDSKSNNRATTEQQQSNTNKELITMNNNDKEITSIVAEATEPINHLMGLFKNINPSYGRLFNRPPQRDALSRLFKIHGSEKIEKAIYFIEKRRSDRFCPQITTPTQLEDKWGALEAYGLKLKTDGNKNKIIIV